MCRTQAVHLIQKNTSQNTEKNTAGGKKGDTEQLLAAATCCSSSGNNILLLVYVTQERLSIRSQHGAVSLNMMTVIVSERARCDLHICSNNTEEGCGL